MFLPAELEDLAFCRLKIPIKLAFYGRDRLSSLSREHRKLPFSVRLGADQDVLAGERLAAEQIQNALEPGGMAPDGLRKELLRVDEIPDWIDTVDGLGHS
jgi:hypothetical protein